MLRKGVILTCTSALIAGVIVSVGFAAGSRSDQARGTLVIAAPKTPDGIDGQYYHDYSTHVIRQAVSAFLISLPLKPGTTGILSPDYAKVGAGKLVGDLAQSWTVSNGGRTLTVHLRKGVMSHAGNELTANDVQWTWDRNWGLKDGSNVTYLKVDLGITHPSWRVVDRYTWELTVPHPNAMIALLQANNDMPIIDSVEAKKHTSASDPWAVKWLVAHDVGFGPYEVSEWSPGTQVVLTGFKNYYKGAPAFDKIIYRAVPDASQRRSLVQTGAVDIAESLNYSDLNALRNVKAVKIWQTRSTLLLKLQFLETNPVFKKFQVRQAMLYAAPVAQILKSAFYGYATPMKGPLSPEEAFAAPDLWKYTYRPALAKKLLAEAGVKPGTSFTLYYSSDYPSHGDIATILKTAYANVGLAVKIQEVPASAFYTNLFTHKYGAAIVQYGFNTPDPAYELLLADSCHGFANAGLYCNPRVDTLLAKGLQTVQPSKRKQIYREVQRILFHDIPEGWLINPGWQLATKTDIKGVAWEPSGIEYFSELRRS